VLVLRPRVILLDEPTAGLDFAGVRAMLGLLNELHGQGTALVISTHDTDLAYEWADEAWVLEEGHVAAEGPISRVLGDPTALHRAHLKIPWLVELGLAIRDTFPEASAQPLPATLEELIQHIQQLRMAYVA
jgi:cobalt/nickel transport system ATP-binding protein